MITIRRAADRGHFDHGWLQTAHTFSFADYRDPEHVQFRSLRVLNEDVVAPGRGFGMHPHRDMEILTWVLGGALRHEDSMGHAAVLRPGEVQVMSAGTGVEHSEWNASETEPVHLLQIWILPDRQGLTPRYAQQAVDRADMRGSPLLLAAPVGEGGVVAIHQDVRILGLELDEAERCTLPLRPGRSAWVQVARGGVAIDGEPLEAGDGAAVTDSKGFELQGRGGQPAELLIFDLA